MDYLNGDGLKNEIHDIKGVERTMNKLNIENSNYYILYVIIVNEILYFGNKMYESFSAKGETIGNYVYLNISYSR